MGGNLYKITNPSQPNVKVFLNSQLFFKFKLLITKSYGLIVVLAMFIFFRASCSIPYVFPWDSTVTSYSLNCLWYKLPNAWTICLTSAPPVAEIYWVCCQLIDKKVIKLAGTKQAIETNNVLEIAFILL